MHKSVVIGIVAAATASAGCGQSRAENGGPTIQRSYTVGSFDQIEVSGPFDVDVKTGGKPSVSAKGPEKLLDRLVVEVKGDKLLIHPKREKGLFHWGFSTHGGAKLQVSAPSLRSAGIAGSGGITVDKVQSDSFEGSVAGSGDLTVNQLAVQSLNLSISGSGDIRAGSGQTGSAQYKIAGSGDIDARGVRAETAAVRIAGSGSVNGQATGTAEVKIAGSGDVEMTGGAKCTVKKAGSGNVTCS